MDDTEFNILLQYFNLSWKGYRKVRKGVKKRLRRHMQSLDCVDIDDYIKKIDDHIDDKTECRRLLTVPITRFFRDRKLWEVLRYYVLPEMISGSKTAFRAWSAGCSGGEEAYSFAIVWQQLASEKTFMPRLEIVATDINPECLNRASEGIYSVNSLKEVSEAVRETFFIRKKKQFQVVQPLKEMVCWKQENLFDDPSGDDFDVIFLRNNLLTYYKEPDKSKGFKTIVSKLKPDGILVIGAHESLPDLDFGLLKSDEHPLIYRPVKDSN